ncbi:Wzz/FepE/Etk N-terminal domain-containing protein [Streptomyces sp. KR80]|uniref:Wzz/FepE/Etk N-terminal domain-containing protein n=1 Tax=Streptomyces sp. KR80 TaxID=3457426 RepID=UPI003FD60785
MTDTVLAKTAPTRLYRRLRSALRLPAWWPLALCAVLGTVCGAAYGVLKTPQYRATSYVVVSADKSTDPATALGYAHAYGRVVTDSVVLGGAQMATGWSVADLRDRVQAVTSPDAPMIEITGSDTRAARAAGNANEVARALTVYANGSTKSTGVRLILLSRALTPTSPVTPSGTLSTAVGLCAGGLIGCLVLLVRPGSRRSSSSGVPAPAAEPRPATDPVRNRPEPANPRRIRKPVRKPSKKLAGDGSR